VCILKVEDGVMPPTFTRARVTERGFVIVHVVELNTIVVQPVPALCFVRHRSADVYANAACRDLPNAGLAVQAAPVTKNGGGPEDDLGRWGQSGTLPAADR